MESIFSWSVDNDASKYQTPRAVFISRSVSLSASCSLTRIQTHTHTLLFSHDSSPSLFLLPVLSLIISSQGFTYDNRFFLVMLSSGEQETTSDKTVALTFESQHVWRSCSNRGTLTAQLRSIISDYWGNLLNVALCLRPRTGSIQRQHQLGGEIRNSTLETPVEKPLRRCWSSLNTLHKDFPGPHYCFCPLYIANIVTNSFLRCHFRWTSRYDVWFVVNVGL